MRKNIIIFSDGTGQEGGVGNNTNVYSLFNMILDRSENQISFYDPGLGTGRSKIGQISGFGISKNVGEAYQFLSDNFNASDQIFLFGFSRGATTVRTLSAFIALFGILPRSRPELFKKAWKIYKMSNRDKRRDLAREFVNLNHTMWTKVRFIGVWDTVAALGLQLPKLDRLIDKIPTFRHSYHDFQMADSVEYGRHALAVDDERQTFDPVLWDERGPRQKGPVTRDRELFSTNDFGDIYLVAERLQDEDNPVSSRVLDRLTNSTQALLKGLLESPGRQASKKKAEELRVFLVEEFNKLITSEEPIYKFDSDPKIVGKQLEELEKSQETRLSAATRSAIDKLVPSYSFHPSPSPSRFDVSRLNRLLLEDTYSLKPRIKQVWFAGMHSDVGGGYAENELAQVALLWMISEAMDLGLLIYEKHNVDLKPDATGTMHDSRAGNGRWFRRRVRQWKSDENQGHPPLVHESVVTRYAEDPLYEPWILKTDYDVEPWPNQLETSIQFNDEHVWREDFWGWGAGFKVAWKDIERISADERAITIHVKNDDDIFVQGSLPRALPALVEQLERKREHQRLTMRDQKLDKQDKELKERHHRLEKKVADLEKHIDKDVKATAKLRETNAGQDRSFIERETPKAEITNLEKDVGADGRKTTV